MVFDLLFLGGQDLRGLPQLERKQRLARLMQGQHAPLTLSPYTRGNGPEAARAACRQGLEGGSDRSCSEVRPGTRDGGTAGGSELVVEVEFRGYTQDGLLRQASLKGLRRDRGVESLRPAGRDVAVITSGGG